MYQQEKLLFADAPASAPTYTPDLQGLVKWLETQDPSCEYDWMNCLGDCLLDRFAKNLPKGRWFGGDGYYGMMKDRQICTVAHELPYTYGAALARAKKAIAGDK